MVLEGKRILLHFDGIFQFLLWRKDWPHDRGHMKTNQDGRLDPAKHLAVYGVQCIKGTITLLKTTIHNEHSWEVMELRSAQIPVNWENRYEFMKVFELLSTLDVSGWNS